MKKLKDINWHFVACYMGSVFLFFSILFGIFYFLTTKIDSQENLQETEKEYYTIDEIVGIDCSKITSIESSIGAVSDKKEYSDIDRILDKRFKPCKNTIENTKGALYVTYSFHAVDSSSDYIVFWGREDIVNNTWSFSRTENFSDIYRPV